MLKVFSEYQEVKRHSYHQTEFKAKKPVTLALISYLRPKPFYFVNSLQLFFV